MNGKNTNDIDTYISQQVASNSIQFLHSLSNVSCIQAPAVKSFYLTKCRLLEFNRNLHLPTQLTKSSVKCNKCLINFKDGPASFKVKSNKKTKFAKRLLVKAEKNQKPLTEYQRKHLKRIDNKLDNELEITCSFCKKETVIFMKKPDGVVKEDIVNIPNTKKRKKKKKDQFCGLNKNLVLSASGNCKGKNISLKLKSQQPKSTPKLTTQILQKLNENNTRDNPIKFKNIKLKNSNSPTKIDNVPKTISLKTKKAVKKLKCQLGNTQSTKKPPTSKLHQFLQGL